MEIAERYARAVGHGRLNGDGLDVVGGAGMVWQRHRLGLLLQRLRACPSGAGLEEAHAALCRLARVAVDRGEVRRDGQRTDAVVADVLAWWIAPARPRARPVPRPEGALAGWVVARLERAVADAEGRLASAGR
jgi:hypothetical protein